ncbi:hypothetical protein SAMN04488028_109104 [Reichenbachiella agariperforans]|uniref:Uncharacterized protein n=1 Tax=Reichenbachiella agariperforans TaxID=156994 RepID=A0A1M6VM03_REIAG|nr:hypothetical protein SAMN04488028_109104 [Reichenbachiella agariperforans]
MIKPEKEKAKFSKSIAQNQCIDSLSVTEQSTPKVRAKAISPQIYLWVIPCFSLLRPPESLAGNGFPL